MANALFNVLEPSVVQLIHEMAVDSDEIEVKVLYYVRDWAETPEFFFLVLPRDATIHDLKIMLTYEELFHAWEVPDMQIYVHQPWAVRYLEVDDYEEVLPWKEDYAEFHLKLT